MYLVDTDVINEARTGERANPGVKAFFKRADEQAVPLYLSAITIGELRQGVETIRFRGDRVQADRLERWLQRVCSEYSDAVLPFDQEIAQIWGRLRVPHPENLLDKQIAATALNLRFNGCHAQYGALQPDRCEVTEPVQLRGASRPVSAVRRRPLYGRLNGAAVRALNDSAAP